jgi:hypothetical protein
MISTTFAMSNSSGTYVCSKNACIVLQPPEVLGRPAACLHVAGLPKGSEVLPGALPGVGREEGCWLRFVPLTVAAFLHITPPLDAALWPHSPGKQLLLLCAVQNCLPARLTKLPPSFPAPLPLSPSSCEACPTKVPQFSQPSPWNRDVA